MFLFYPDTIFSITTQADASARVSLLQKIRRRFRARRGCGFAINSAIPLPASAPGFRQLRGRLLFATVTKLRSRLSIRRRRALREEALISPDLQSKFRFIIAKLTSSYGVALRRNRRERRVCVCARVDTFALRLQSVRRVVTCRGLIVPIHVGISSCRVRVQSVTLHSLFLRRRRSISSSAASPRLSP